MIKMKDIESLNGMNHCDTNGFHCELKKQNNNTYLLTVKKRNEDIEAKAIFKNSKDMIELYKALHMYIFE